MAERILFISSNGTGLGHLTRSMAIARRLGPDVEPLFFTLSGAAPVVAAQGFPVEFASSYATPTAGSDWRWSRRLRARLRAIFRDADPRALVFDGAHPYQALLDAMPAVPDAHRVWSRRPMWKPGANFGAIERTRFFDQVLEPGEFAAVEDRGATVARRSEVNAVAPVVFCEDDELLPRADAERELGVEPGAVNVLVQLGQGAAVQGANERVLRHLAARDGVRVAALSSALSALPDVPEGVVDLEATYPISRYLRAFDVAVSAAGYNAYHELIRFGVPALYVPMPRQTDDQPARARFAHETGVGRGVDGPDAPELEAMLDELLDPAARDAATSRLAELRPENGAGPAARWLEELMATERVRNPGVPAWRKYAQHPLASARAAAPYAARVPGAVGRVVHPTVTRKPARTLIDATGLDAATIERELPGALAALQDPPEQVLVVVDDLAALPTLRAAGVGAEHGAGRLDLITAERPKIRRRIALRTASESTPAGTLESR